MRIGRPALVLLRRNNVIEILLNIHSYHDPTVMNSTLTFELVFDNWLVLETVQRKTGLLIRVAPAGQSKKRLDHAAGVRMARGSRKASRP